MHEREFGRPWTKDKRKMARAHVASVMSKELTRKIKDHCFVIVKKGEDWPKNCEKPGKNENQTPQAVCKFCNKTMKEAA